VPRSRGGIFPVFIVLSYVGPYTRARAVTGKHNMIHIVYTPSLLFSGAFFRVCRGLRKAKRWKVILPMLRLDLVAFVAGDFPLTARARRFGPFAARRRPSHSKASQTVAYWPSRLRGRIVGRGAEVRSPSLAAGARTATEEDVEASRRAHLHAF